jgi:hypothetical protein
MSRSRVAKLFSRTYPTFLLIFGFGLLLSTATQGQSWDPVGADEFRGPLGTPIDTSKWTFETGILKVNNELEYYCAPGMTTGGCDSSKPNAYINDRDHPVIQAIKINSSAAPYSGSWTSARMTPLAELTTRGEQVRFAMQQTQTLSKRGGHGTMLWP